MKRFAKRAIGGAVCAALLALPALAGAATVTPSGVSATSTQGGHIAANAIDKASSTRWEASSMAASITLKLASCQKLNDFTIHWYGTNTYFYKAELSRDGGATWAHVTTTSGSGSSDRTNTNDQATNAIRISGNGSTLRINEIIVNASGPSHCEVSTASAPAPIASATQTPAPSARSTPGNVRYPADVVGGLARWHLTLPVSAARKQYPADEIDQPKLSTYSGDFFKLNADKNAIVMTALFGGATTSSGTAYSRSELREHNADYSDAAWSCKSDTRSMTFTSRIVKSPTRKPEVSMAQIHDGDSDNFKVMYLGPAGGNGHSDSGKIVALFNGGTQKPVLDNNYTIGQKITVTVSTHAGMMKVDYKNLSTGFTNSVSQAFGTVIGACHFKVGNFHHACSKTNIYGGINQTCVAKNWSADKYEADPFGQSVTELYALSIN